MASKKKNGVRPIPMILTCPNPECCKRHIDRGEFATKVHHTHACQFCGLIWRPAIVPTVGVQFLPGFKDGLKDEDERVRRIGVGHYEVDFKP